MNKLTFIAFSFSLPFLSACTPSIPTLPDMPDILPDLSLPTLYKDDIQQGSVLTRFKINQLKIGMSTAQVQDLIGSPSIIDPFHNDQWDYINHSTLHEQADIHYRLILKFNQNQLTLKKKTQLERNQQKIKAEKTLETQQTKVIETTKPQHAEQTAVEEKVKEPEPTPWYKFWMD